MTECRRISSRRLKAEARQIIGNQAQILYDCLKFWGGGKEIPSSLCPNILKIKTEFFSGSCDLSNIKALG